MNSSGNTTNALSPLDIGGVGLIALAEGTYAVRYTTIAFIILMVYDYLITLDHEVEMIWPMQWRLPKILFFVNRYVAPPLIIFTGIVPNIPHLSNKFCTNAWDHASLMTWPTIIAIGTAELILIPRVSALYGNSKLIYGILILLFLTELGSVFAIVKLIGLMNSSPIETTFSFLPGCFTVGSENQWSVWVPPVVFESVIIIVTLFKFFDLTCVNSQNGSLTLRILVRDSLVYFSFMFSFLLANLLIDRFSPWYLHGLMIGPSSCIACVAASRMMLNLRRLTNRDDLDFTIDLNGPHDNYELRILPM